MKQFFLLLIISFLFSCSPLEEEIILPSNPDLKSTENDSKEDKLPSVSISSTPSNKAENVEVLWQVESTPPEGFILKYGESPQLLSAEVRILTTELEKVSEPKFGSVYRYVIKGIQPESRLFVSIASFSGTLESAFSNPTEVPR